MTAGKIVVQFFSVGSFFLIINALTLKEYGLLQLLFTALGPGTVIAMLGIERLLVAVPHVVTHKEPPLAQ